VRLPAALPTAAPRREFLGQLATSAAAIVGAGYLTGEAGAQAASAAAPPADRWLARITGKHKAVFDAPEIAEGVVAVNAWVFLKSYTEARALTDRDLSAVVVIRHSAIPLAFDDAIWEKYETGKHAKVKDPVTKKWARRNVYWKAAAGDTENAPFTLGALNDRGVILVGCGLATTRIAGTIATRTGQPREAVLEELKAHLIPGMQLAPSGIYAVTLAQEAGCSFVRST
jgi:hypothetical protein